MSPLQSIQSVAETPAHGDELQKQVWLTTKEAASYVRRSLSAFYKWRTRHGLAACSRYRRTVLDALIERENRLRDLRRRRRGGALRARQSQKVTA